MIIFVIQFFFVRQHLVSLIFLNEWFDISIIQFNRIHSIQKDTLKKKDTLSTSFGQGTGLGGELQKVEYSKAPTIRLHSFIYFCLYIKKTFKIKYDIPIIKHLENKHYL